MVLSFFLITLILFILGSVVGSFLNVVIYRTVNDESWVWGRSKCDHCSAVVHWYDNIPLLSYIILKAKCRECEEPIALSYPVVEFLTGSLFVWWYWSGSLFFQLTHSPFQTLQPLFWLTVGVLLLLIAVADALYYIIPDVIVGLLMVISLAYRVFLVLFGIMQLSDFVVTVVAMVVVVSFFAGLWLLTKGRGMGMGDVKLVAPLALLLGWPKVLVAMFMAFIIGSIVGVILLALGKKQVHHVVPFGPFLVIGTFIGLVFGNQLVTWYLSIIF